MTFIVSITNSNHNIQVKDVIFTKIYIEKLFDKNIVNQLFDITHLKIQTHELISKIYKNVIDFKFALQTIKNVAIIKFNADFDSKIVVQDFLNLLYQLCFEVLMYWMYCNSIN